MSYFLSFLSASAIRCALGIAGLAAATVIVHGPARAATQTWTGAVDTDWATTGNWNTAVPGSSDVGLFDVSSTANLGVSLATPATVGGLRVTSPAGAVSIGSSTLTLGTGGIDMASATQNLTVSSGVALGAVTAVPFSVADGRTMSLSGGFSRSAGQTAKFTTSGTGAINVSAATVNTVLSYGVTNGIDFAAANASKNIVGAASVITYISNPAGTSNNASVSGGSSTTWMDVTTSNPAAAPSAFRFSGNYALGGLRFNQANTNSIDWVVDANSRNFTLGAILVTGSVGAFNVQMNDSSGNVWRLAAGAEAMIHQYNTSGDLIFNGKITQTAGSGASVTKDGPGRVILTNNSNAWSGATNLVEGTIQVGNNGTSGVLGTGNVINNGSLVFRRSNDITSTNLISGTGGVSQTGGGVLTLNNVSNSYAGGTMLSSGTVTYVNGLADFGSGGLNFSGGAFQWKAADSADVSTRTVTINAGGARLNPNGNSVTLANPIGNSGAGGLSLVGSGTLNLAAGNVFSGTSSINAGVLRANNSTGSALGSGPVNVNLGGTLSGTGSVSGLVTVASGGVLSPGNAAVGSLTLGSLTTSGGSSLIWEFNANPANDLVVVTTLNGLTINGGALSLFNEGAVTPFSTNGIYNLIQYSGAISGTGVGSLSVANQQAGKAYTFGTSGGFVTLSIADSGLVASWNVDANGNWTTGANWTPSEPNAAGDTAIFGAAITAPRTVTLDANRTIGNISFNNANAYTISPAAAEVLTVGDGTADKTLQVVSGSHTIASALVLSATTITADIAAGQSLTLSGPISGTAALTKGVSAGTLVLTGSNSYSGGTNINLGTLEFAANALGGTAVSINGGTIRYAAGNSEDISSKTITFGASGATIDTNGNDVTLANTIGNAGTGGFTKSGAGTLTLGGSNSYTGATTISGGTLAIAANENLGDLTANASVVLVGGALQTPASFTTGRTIVATSPSTLAAGDGTTLSGALAGTQPITRTGAGLLTLTGSSTGFSGGMVLAAGTTTLGGGQANGFNAIGTGPITFQNGSALNLNGVGQADNATSWGTLTGAITVAAGQSGTLNMPPRATISGSLTGSGTLTVNVAGTRDEFQGNWGAFAGSLNLAGSGDFRLANFQNSVFTNSKLNIGAGVSVYQVFNPPSGSGTETVQPIGELSGAGSLGGNPAAGRFVNWTVGGLSTSSTFAGSINDTSAAGAAKLTKVGTGALTLTGTSTYTGATTVSAGSLLVDGLLGTTAVTVGSAGLLGGNGTLPGAVTVSGTLSPGNSPGLITLGTLTLNPSATTLIEVVSAGTRGVDYDAIDVTGLSGLTYGGALSIGFGGTPLPENTLLNVFGFTGTPSSSFSGVSSTGFYSGAWTNQGAGVWQITSGTSTAIFSESAGTLSIVPEPTSAVVLAAGLGVGMLLIRSRKRCEG